MTIDPGTQKKMPRVCKYVLVAITILVTLQMAIGWLPRGLYQLLYVSDYVTKITGVSMTVTDNQDTESKEQEEALSNATACAENDSVDLVAGLLTSSIDIVLALAFGFFGIMQAFSSDKAKENYDKKMWANEFVQQLIYRQGKVSIDKYEESSMEQTDNELAQHLNGKASDNQGSLYVWTVETEAARGYEYYLDSMSIIYGGKTVVFSGGIMMCHLSHSLRFNVYMADRQDCAIFSQFHQMKNEYVANEIHMDLKVKREGEVETIAMYRVKMSVKKKPDTGEFTIDTIQYIYC